MPVEPLRTVTLTCRITRNQRSLLRRLGKSRGVPVAWIVRAAFEREFAHANVTGELGRMAVKGG